ncbi:MAG: hypothetical protein IPM79_16750 [Polyangiaceae bacterium]|nr:hypothetical protein [Polyangiaceae bacterium]
MTLPGSSGLGTFPFGAPLHVLEQEDRTPKRVFVLGVYASAVHATWYGSDGRVRVRSLAVASEPAIFWTGEGADACVEKLTVPSGAGRLVAADARLNGPSGRSLDDDYLRPLGFDRRAAWLCDLVPHTCLNPRQKAALEREYEPVAASLGLPAVRLPDVPRVFADATRRAEILAEVEAAAADVVILLGDQPIRHWLRFFDSRWLRLSSFGDDPTSYGRLHDVTLAGRARQVLPLAHPRQVSALGTHSERWRALHEAWKQRVAPSVVA